VTTYHVRHSTRYEYEVPVMHAHHFVHLRPRPLAHQTVHLTELEISPDARGIFRQRDYFGNDCDAIELLTTHDCLEVTARSVVSLVPSPLAEVDLGASPTWEQVVTQLKQDTKFLRERELGFDSPLVRRHALLQSYVSPSFPAGRPILQGVADLNRRIYDDFTYEPAATDVSTPLGKVMRERRGVCQDFAHVAIGCLRSVGLAARYVSGYLETTPPPGVPRLVGADASHAWASVFVPAIGWFDFDPTNGTLPSDRHITIGWGRDFSDVSPLKGVVVGGGNHRLSVGVDVIPKRESSEAPPANPSKPPTSGPPPPASV